MAQKRRYKKKSNKNSKIDIVVISLIVFSILLAVLIYTKSGIVGLKLNEILGGMFGIIQYIIPIGIFAVAIKLVTNEEKDLTAKLVQYTIFIISLSVLCSVVQISAGELQSNKEMSEVMKDAYTLGSQSKGGGAIGALAAIPIAKLLGDIGAIIFCIGIAGIFLVFTFGISMSEIIQNIVDYLNERKEERHEEKLRRSKEPKEQATETSRERKRREKQERMAQKNEKMPTNEQIRINFGGRIVDNIDEKPRIKEV